MYQHILVPIDIADEKSCRPVLAHSVDLARNAGARLTLLTVIPDFGMPVVEIGFPADFSERMENEVETKLARIAANSVPADLPCERRVATGTVYEAIIRTAGEIGADLVVVGAHRPNMPEFLIGSNASRVVHHAGCSVLVVRDAALRGR